jgi:hypothetical protein
MNDDIDILLPIPPRSEHKRGPARDALACRLRAMGWSIPEISHHLGFDANGNGDQRVVAAIRRALATTIRIARDETRLMELESLYEVERGLWLLLRANPILVNNGRIIRDEYDVPLPDQRFFLEVVDRLVRVKEMRAKLTGINAPTRAEILTIDSVESAINDLEREIQAYRGDGKNSATGS